MGLAVRRGDFMRLGEVAGSGSLDRSIGALLGRPGRTPLHRGGRSSDERARVSFSVRYLVAARMAVCRRGTSLEW